MRQQRYRRHRTPTPTYPKSTTFVDLYGRDSVGKIHGFDTIHSDNNNWWLKWQEDIVSVQVVRPLMVNHSRRNRPAASSVKGHLSDTSMLTDAELEPSSHASDLHGM